MRSTKWRPARLRCSLTPSFIALWRLPHVSGCGCTFAPTASFRCTRIATEADVSIRHGHPDTLGGVPDAFGRHLPLRTPEISLRSCPRVAAARSARFERQPAWQAPSDVIQFVIDHAERTRGAESLRSI